jgi:DNA-binding response OmpR family regulator
MILRKFQITKLRGQVSVPGLPVPRPDQRGPFGIRPRIAEAIHLIDTEPFVVLPSDLYLPGAGDGFTVVGAMRHKHPGAITLLFTGYHALQADEIMVKPMPIPQLLALIREKLQ